MSFASFIVSTHEPRLLPTPSVVQRPSLMEAKALSQLVNDSRHLLMLQQSSGIQWLHFWATELRSWNTLHGLHSRVNLGLKLALEISWQIASKQLALNGWSEPWLKSVRMCQIGGHQIQNWEGRHLWVLISQFFEIIPEFAFLAAGMRSWRELHTSQVCRKLGGDLSEDFATVEKCLGWASSKLQICFVHHEPTMDPRASCFRRCRVSQQRRGLEWHNPHLGDGNCHCRQSETCLKPVNDYSVVEKALNFFLQHTLLNSLAPWHLDLSENSVYSQL